MILKDEELKRYLKHSPPLVEGVEVNSPAVQPNGIELSVDEVYEFKTWGSIGASNQSRVIPEGVEVRADEGGRWTLNRGAYRVRMREVVHIPLDVFAVGKPRSSMLRCGVSVETALWDSGYEGRSEVLMVVHNPVGFRLERGARILQLVFFKLEGEVGEGYDGRYQGENI